MGVTRTARHIKHDLTDVLHVRRSFEGMEGLLNHESHLTSFVGILLVLETRYLEEFSDRCVG